MVESPMGLHDLPHMATKSVLGKALLFSYQVYVILFFFLFTLFWGLVSDVASFFDVKGNMARWCITR